MRNIMTAMFMVGSICICCCLFTACSNGKEKMTDQQTAAITDTVKQLANNIAVSITSKGPGAWLDFFEDTPAFFMASDGHIAFANYDSAKNFIQNILVKNLRSIKLEWSNMRIDVLAPGLANLAANFHEDITGNDGAAAPYNGYFTAIAEQTAAGWKLRNLHWSLQH